MPHVLEQQQNDIVVGQTSFAVCPLLMRCHVFMVVVCDVSFSARGANDRGQAPQEDEVSRVAAEQVQLRLRDPRLQGGHRRRMATRARAPRRHAKIGSDGEIDATKKLLPLSI